jgi:hypothetical protein
MENHLVVIDDHQPQGCHALSVALRGCEGLTPKSTPMGDSFAAAFLVDSERVARNVAVT